MFSHSMAHRHNPKIKHKHCRYDEYFILPQNDNTNAYSLTGTAYYKVGTITPEASNPNYMFAPGKGNLYGGNTVCTPYPKNIYQLYSPTAGDNAVCKTTDLDLYQLGNTCVYNATTNTYSQTGTLKPDSLLDQLWTASTGTSGITITKSKNGGLSCSDQFGNTVSTKSITNPNPVCSNANAVCTTDLTLIYSDPGVNTTTCTTTDNISWYRRWNLNNAIYLDNIANGITITPKISPTMGLSCSAQIIANPTLYPYTTYIGTGTTAASYCRPVNGVCNDVVVSNTEDNYTFTGPVPGSTLIPIDATVIYIGTNLDPNAKIGNIGGNTIGNVIFLNSGTTAGFKFGPFTFTNPVNGGLTIQQVLKNKYPSTGSAMDITTHPGYIMVNKTGYMWATSNAMQTSLQATLTTWASKFATYPPYFALLF